MPVRLATQCFAAPSPARKPISFQPVRHATLIRRPRRPYTFTQLVTLSDGSTFLHRTTSPLPVYRSTKDTRNSALWNPSSSKLLNIEADEAGRLRAFRARYGRGWDGASPDEMTAEDGAEGTTYEQSSGSLTDLISGYSKAADGTVKDQAKEKTKDKKTK